VPSSHQSPARTPSQGKILLLEEYDAVAAAIGSALRKFAPGHTVSRARSLVEAERFSGEIKPELFILDVDPPWAGITEFLEELRGSYPNARALVIGAPIPEEISVARGSFGALQFVGKPFELAAFGAAVQAVLGPWREAASTNRRGRAGLLNTADHLLVHFAAAANVVLGLKTNGHSGKIWICDGQPVQAESGSLSGPEALQRMLDWSAARPSESKLKGVPKKTIGRAWQEILVEAVRQTTPVTAPRISPAEEEPAKPTSAARKKIVVVDDTDMLLIFVEDVLATADPNLQISTARTGAEGVERVGQVQPDLVLLDYSLPDFNGDEVCRRLLENERTARVPVLMMSGHVVQMKATAEHFGNVVATIEKPFLSEALVQLVKKTLATGPRPRPAVAKKIEPTKPVPPPPSPPPPVSKPAPAAPPAPEPAPHPAPLRPAILETSPPQSARAPMVSVSASEGNVAILGLFLEVISMQLTPQLQMGAIRGRPASPIVSLQLPSRAAQGAIPAETGFQLGATALDQSGRISKLQLLPTKMPFKPAQTRSAFEIGGVALIPNHTRARVQLTPAGTTPMTIELLALLDLSSVQLSPTFQVAQLILSWRGSKVRVTLDPKSAHKSGATFETVEVKLDGAGRIAELLLKPAT